MKTRTPTLAPEVLSGSAKIMAVEKEVDRVLNLLRAKIHERGYTQLKVQRALGWGRTYISQLFRKQKSLRFDQILQILEVVEIDPADFFAEFYRLPHREPLSGVGPLRPERPVRLPGDVAEAEKILELAGNDPRSVVYGIVRLLMDKGVLDAVELSAAVGRVTSDREDYGGAV